MASLSRPQPITAAKSIVTEPERLFFLHSQDGMILLRVDRDSGNTPRFTIEAENPTAIARLTALGQEENFTGRDIQDVLPEWLHKKLGIHYAACADSAATRRYEIVHAGSTHESIATPILSDDGTVVEHIAVIMRDVGDRVQQEKKLNMALARAEEANRSKSEFFASMSHELRTPLNAILGFSEMMEKGFGGTLSSQHVEYAEHIHSSGQHLLAIISDILDLSKIEAGHFTLHESQAQVADIIENCAQMVRERAQRKSLTLVTDMQPGMPLLQADPLRIKQILLNLLSNAIKFTDKGDITLTARYSEQGFCFCVTDHGIGMSAEELETALQPFGQVEDAYARNRDGTGLGLPIASQLAQMHQGRLELVSRKSEGTQAMLFLPPERAVPSGA